LKVGSLFAGVGGFDIAAERAGMEVAWQSENDVKASTVLEHYWPDLNLGDIHDITNPPAVDVLCGGFPCQDYSVAGNREGLVGDRGALWWQFHRLIDEGRPTWVVAENVPGLLSSRDGEDFATIIDSLTELGYGVVWGVLDAQWFGVAQRRRRVFIVGHSGGRPRPEVLALSEGVFGHPEPIRETGDKPAHTVAAHAAKGGDPTTDNYVVFAQNQRDEVRDPNNLAGALAAEPGMKQQTYVMRQREGKPGGGKGPLLSEDRSLTLAANTNDQTLFQGTTVRRLTPLECERLQGFPDGWTDIEGNSNAQRYRQMGNAVAVPVVEWIFRNIANAS